MGTATILGDVYPTTTLPDGKEWTAANLAWAGAGQWWNNGASDDGDGRYYTRNDAWSTVAAALVGTGWRIPTLAEWRAMITAIGGTAAGGSLKTTDQWDAPNTGATDTFGFGGAPAGFCWTTSGWWQAKTTTLRCWAADEEDTPNPNTSYAFLNHNSANIAVSGAADPDVFYWSIRLVRDAVAPYACPAPEVSATFKPSVPVETVTFASGRSRRVSRGTQALYLDATFAWTFSYEEYEAFVAWWDTDLAYGTLPTTVDAPWGDTVQTHSFRFRGKYSVTREAFSYRVSAPVRITDFHTTIYESFGNLYQTTPVAFPTELPPPQEGHRERVAQLRTDIDGNDGASASPLSDRGFVLDFEWSLDGLQLDQFVVWFSNCLRCGQRKFKTAFGPLAEMVYTVLGEPTITILGADRRVAMTVQAVVPKVLPSSVIPMHVDVIDPTGTIDIHADTINSALDLYVDTIGAT